MQKGQEDEARVKDQADLRPFADLFDVSVQQERHSPRVVSALQTQRTGHVQRLAQVLLGQRPFGQTSVFSTGPAAAG